MGDIVDEDLFERLPDTRARDALVDAYRPLALHCARRYAHRGAEIDDLRQVAMIGLLQSIDRFDPGHGARFSSFAVPTICGELKRYFRDHLWAMSVPRRLKDLVAATRRADEELTQALGRSPQVVELAEHMGVSVRDIADVMSLDSAWRPSSLDDASGGGIHLVATPDRSMGVIEDMDGIRALMGTMSDLEREVLLLRFWHELTQDRIAEMVGVSQMQVSRILARTLEDVRVRLSV